MRHLGLALFAEGPTDHRFLAPLLKRAAEQLCLNRAVETIEVADVLELRPPRAYRHESRAVRIHEAAREAVGAYQILFVHADGHTDADRVRAEQVDPGIQMVREALGDADAQCVPVIPVRETEAWIVADADAVRKALGTSLSARDLGLPNTPRASERIHDPKVVLDTAYSRVVGQRKRRLGVSRYFDVIAERSSLQVLRDLPSYSTCEAALADALVVLRFIS